MSRRTSRVYGVQTALDGIRQMARGRRDARFDNLRFHIYAIERLRVAYFADKRDAAAGVDGQTWHAYGEALEANLLDLSDRLARGRCRPQHCAAAVDHKGPLMKKSIVPRRSSGRASRGIASCEPII